MADLKIAKLYAIAEVVEPEEASSGATNDDQLVAGAHIVQWVIGKVTRKEKNGLARDIALSCLSLVVWSWVWFCDTSIRQRAELSHIGPLMLSVCTR